MIDYDRRRREISISDYGYLIRAESVFTDRGGYHYLVLERAADDDRVSDASRNFVACALALLFAALLAATIWFVYFAPGLGSPAGAQ